MAIITLSNAKRIVSNSKINDLNLEGRVYTKPIYFFSRYEVQRLLSIQELLKNPDHYFKHIYKKVITTDTFSLVYEGRKPAYHSHVGCQMLHSNYKNFYIPDIIRKSGSARVVDFRNWFEDKKHLLETRPAIFEALLRSVWEVETNIKGLTQLNSGKQQVIVNYNLEKLIPQIDVLIKDAKTHYYASERNTSILRQFSKCTFLAYKDIPILNNQTGYNDNDVKSVLKEYDSKFKKPLTDLLIEYYRLTCNPQIQLKGMLLEQLGFIKCRHCHN